MTTYIGRVTDDTDPALEYGDYRGWVEIDGATGEWQRNLTDEERAALTLGPAEYSREGYADLRPVLTTVTTRDLADEMADRYDITTDAARQGVDTYVGQLVDIDGDEATIAATEERRNASGRIVGQEITLTAAAADAVRDSFAAEYAN